MVTQASKVLFLTTLIPSQRVGGGEVASQTFIDGLRQNGCQVSVVGYMRKDAVFEPKSYERVVEERYIETYKARAYPLIWLALSLLIGLPYSAAKYYSRAYLELVKSLLSVNQFDVVVIDHSQLGWLVRLLGGRHRIIFIAHNIEHDIYVSHYNNSNNFLKKWLYAREARLIKKLEANLLRQAAEVWALTDYDASYFSGISEGSTVKTLALPSVQNSQCGKVIEKTFDIGLIGSWTWKFNEEGLRWFLEFVYPELPEQLSIHVAGKGAEWLNGKYPNVRYEGFVPNAQVFMAQARVVALPILGGSGIQIKTLDALASGSAIVATPTSMRGISLNSSVVKIAEHPKDFAAILSSVVYEQSNQTVEDSNGIALEWFRTRKEQFLQDLASSVEYTSPTVASVDKKLSQVRT
ncbi:MAG: glycosyltransferase [Phormidesmis sp.]